MLRSYRYRLSPTKAQARELLAWLDMTRELYNAALQERRDAWQKQRIRVTAYDQMHALASVRLVRPEFADVPIVVLRGAVRRLDRAYAGFYRRCKSGGTPGYPRFRGCSRWSSLSLEDLHDKALLACGGRRLLVPLLGQVKIKLHRPLEGRTKALHITLAGDGHWYATFACVDVPMKPLPPSDDAVGIDLGLSAFVATSDGELFDNPRTLERERLMVERAQRRVTRRKRKSNGRRAARRLLARAHARVANVRREHHIAVARSLVTRYGVICVEKLNIKGLASGMLAKQVHDAGWGNFLHWLHVKAEEAGREVVEVDPRGTSQACSACDAHVEKSLAVRVHRCPSCGLVLDRDVNAARNMLRLGTSLRGAALPVRGRQRSAKSKSPAFDRGTPADASGV